MDRKLESKLTSTEGIPRRAFLGGTIGLLASTLAGCNGQPKEPSTVDQSTQLEEEEERPLTLADYKMRMEPFGGTMETAQNYMRERLDSVGSTPQVCDPAYKLSDAVKAGGGVLDTQTCKEMFPQLSQNLAHVINFMLANPDLAKDQGPFLPALLQDVFAGIDMGGKKPIGPFFENSFVQEFLIPLSERLTPGTFIKEVNILEANYTYQHAVLDIVGQRPTDPEPINLAMPEIPNSAPNLVLQANPYIPYEASTDFDKSVQVAFTP